MNYSILRSRESLETLAVEWDSVLAASSGNTVFLTYDWVTSWLESFGDEQPELVTIAVRDSSGALVGIAPFYKIEYRFLKIITVRALQILGDTSSGAEYGCIIVDKRNEATAISLIRSALLQLNQEWDILRITNVASWKSDIPRIISALAKPPFSFRSRNVPFASFELPTSHDTYLSGLSRNMRSQLKRQTKKLNVNESISIDEVQSPEKLEYATRALFSLHETRWRTRNDSGSFNRKLRQKHFYVSFLPKALKNRWLKLFYIRDGNKPIAVQYGLSYQGTFHQLQEGFDLLGYSGAGNVLRLHIIEHLIDCKHKYYDFLGGYTEHKRRWGSTVRTGSDYLVMSNSLLGLFFKLIRIWPSGRYMYDKKIGRRSD